MAIKMDGNAITELELHASDGTTETKQLTEELNLQNKTATANGEVTADEGYDGLGTVTVSVSGDTPTYQEKTVTENGTVLPDEGYDALSKVTVNVSGGGELPELTNPASAADILDGKEAIDGNGAKLTGTCTYDADTSDADAVASDIAQGKTAYVNGTKLTGTNTGGETIYYCRSSGLPYTANMELTMTYNQYRVPTNVFISADKLESLIFHGYDTGVDAGMGSNLINWGGSLRVLKLPDYTGSPGMRTVVSTSIRLQEVELGRIGKPVKKIATNFYQGGPQYSASPTITIYVEAETLADVPTTNLSANAPWGFTDPTIIYRSSTTGEVLA